MHWKFAKDMSIGFSFFICLYVMTEELHVRFLWRCILRTVTGISWQLPIYITTIMNTTLKPTCIFACTLSSTHYIFIRMKNSWPVHFLWKSLQVNIYTTSFVLAFFPCVFLFQDLLCWIICFNCYFWHSFLVEHSDTCSLVSCLHEGYPVYIHWSNWIFSFDQI